MFKLISVLFLISLVCCQLGVVICADKSECSPFDDKFIRNGKCRPCRRCDEGKGRNFTQTVEVIEKLDKTKCLPCEKCPDGSFNDGKGFKSSCRPCTNDKCYKLKREIQQRCTSTVDQMCGSCMVGFIDYHRDHKQPCYRDTSRSSTTQPLNTLISMRLKTPEHDNLERVKGPNGQEQFDPKIVVAISVCVPLVCTMVVIPIVMSRRRRGRQRTLDVSSSVIGNNPCVPHCSMTTLGSSVNELSSLMKDQSLLLDGATEDVEKQVKGPSKASSSVRGELHNCYPPSGDRSYGPVPQSEHEVTNEEPADKCGCSVEHCGPACKASSIDEQIVNKNDKMLNLIVCNICHSPDEFFTALEMKPSEIYNLEDNRKRNHVTQREFIRSVLSRWVEVKGGDATYVHVRKALCVGGFHRINHELFLGQSINQNA